MVEKVKENYEKTRYVKNNDKSKNYILRGQRNARYYDRILSNIIKSNNYNFISNSTKSYVFTISSVQKAYDISRKGSHPRPAPTSQQNHKYTNHWV